MEVVFYSTERGREPVRDWLRALAKVERRTIGTDIKNIQFSWPLGLPLVWGSDLVLARKRKTSIEF